MSDNVGIKEGADKQAATDEIAGIHYQRMKLIHGIDGVNDGDVALSNGLPVQFPDKAGSGTLTELDSVVELDINGHGSVAFQITGTWVGTMVLDATVDGIEWSSIAFFKSGFNTGAISSTVENGQYRAIAPMGFAKVRLRMAAYMSGTASATINSSIAPQDTLDFAGLNSEENESTIPLSDGQTFTGEYVNVLHYGTVTTSVTTDKSGVLYIDFANPALDIVKIETHAFSQPGTFLIHPIQGEFIRVRLTNNSGSDQTSLDLSTVFKKYAMSSEFTTLEGAVEDDSVATLGRAILLAKNEDEIWGNIERSLYGNLKVSVEEVRGWRTEMAYDANNNLQYIGKAQAGSLTSLELWQIKKLVYSSGNLTQILFADGDQKYNNIWDNKATYSYS